MSINLRFTTLCTCILLMMQNICIAESTHKLFLGESDYINNCADCHGNDGKGNGPRAKQLSATPSDLTQLSKQNGDSFPETAVYNIIDGRRVGDFHGQEMPIWGEHFQDLESDDSAVEDRISNLIEYLKSIQVISIKE
ncbi:MAG: c-type cytochrome [Gammaproteobacteria bacterium]